MELFEANRILRSVKYALVADGYKLPSSAETDGLMMLLGRLDAEKYLKPKIKHAKTLSPDSAAFDRAVKYISFFRALQAVKTPLLSPVAAMSVMLLNKSLCGDLDCAAGKPRTSSAVTDGNAHTDPKYISGSFKSIITKMNELTSAPEASKDDFAGYLSHYMRELIILHPFERCSEFTVRIFIMQFCKLKGFSMNYQRVPVSVIKSAESDALAADDVTPLYKLFGECLSYEHKTAQAPQRVAPRTRREVARDLCRPPRTELSAAAQDRHDDKPDGKVKQKPLSNDEVLKRAIRLQQKISKLNEQLTELIQPLENKNDG